MSNSVADTKKSGFVLVRPMTVKLKFRSLGALMLIKHFEKEIQFTNAMNEAHKDLLDKCEMADNSLNISIPYKFEIKTPPFGMTDYDPKALGPEQQKELNIYKLNVRKENLVYLAEHPEVRALVAMVARMTKIQQPRDVIEFVAKIFTRSEREIRQDVCKILNETIIEYEPIPYSDYEDWDH